MSRAIRAKTARGRANEAIRQIKSRRTLGRSFDDCFEMGDGHEVVRLIVAHAKTDTPFLQRLRQLGFGDWLDRYDPRPEPMKFPPPEPCRQRELFDGLDCLPGQLDLFEESTALPLDRAAGDQ